MIYFIDLLMFILFGRYGPPPSYPNLKIPGVTVPMNEAILGNIFFNRDEATTTFEKPKELSENELQLWGELEDEELYEEMENNELPVENNLERSNIDFMT